MELSKVTIKRARQGRKLSARGAHRTWFGTVRGGPRAYKALKRKILQAERAVFGAQLGAGYHLNVRSAELTGSSFKIAVD